MAALAKVAVHPSVFPKKVQGDLLRSLHARRIDPKFHYTSHKQARKWLRLHESYSPARTDPDCVAIYERAFLKTREILKSTEICLIGLGCGGGQKDAQFLNVLKGQGRGLAYIPCDVSLPLVLTSSETAEAAGPGIDCRPLMCDLAAAGLRQSFDELDQRGSARVFTFFGMIPNFEPEIILPRLAQLLRPNDQLLLGANLAPGLDYAAGVERVLPGYDNDLTRDWLGTFLHDLGIEKDNGTITFGIEDSPAALKQIVADYQFSEPANFVIEGETFEFKARDKIRLFFSYRYTPDLIRSLLAAQKISVMDKWITKSGEEGIFLCQRA